MFTTRRADKAAYKNVFGETGPPTPLHARTEEIMHHTDGLYRIGKYEGLPGLYKGTLLGIIGVSNGAIQFMAYEELKKYARERKMRRGVSETEAVDLVRQTLPFIASVNCQLTLTRRVTPSISYFRVQPSSSQSSAHTRIKSYAADYR